MTKANAYSLFVKDEMYRRQRAGQKADMGSLFKECDALWRNQPEEVKQRYKDRAKNGPGPSAPKPKTEYKPSSASSSQQSNSRANVSAKPDQDVKVDQDVRDVKPDVKPVIKEDVDDKDRGTKRCLDVELHDSEIEIAKKRAKLGYNVPNWKNIKNLSHADGERYSDYHLVKVRNSCESIISTRGDRLMTMPLYSYSANVLCKHKENDKDRYVPIEIGICCYTINKGTIREPYHVLIDPGPVPSGCYNLSKDHSATHKISFNATGGYPPEARKDYHKIYKEMLKYTKAGERTILIADERDLAQVQGTIEWLYDKSSLIDNTMARPSTWTILPIVEYVASAYNFVYQEVLHSPKPCFTLHYFLKIALESSMWDYDETLMCPYHKKNLTKWCARNCSIRSIKCLEQPIEDIYRKFEAATGSERNSKRS